MPRSSKASDQATFKTTKTCGLFWLTRSATSQLVASLRRSWANADQSKRHHDSPRRSREGPSEAAPSRRRHPIPISAAGIRGASALASRRRDGQHVVRGTTRSGHDDGPTDEDRPEQIYTRQGALSTNAQAAADREVSQLRRFGAGWPDIAQALRVSRQAARQKYTVRANRD